MNEKAKLTDKEIFDRVRELLWPWDESRCRVCGWPLHQHNPFTRLHNDEPPLTCTPENCSERPAPERRADSPDLDNWNGVGLMLDEMIKRGFLPYLSWVGSAKQIACKLEKPFTSMIGYGYGHRPFIAVAKAILAVLEK